MYLNIITSTEYEILKKWRDKIGNKEEEPG